MSDLATNPTPAEQPAETPAQGEAKNPYADKYKEFGNFPAREFFGPADKGNLVAYLTHMRSMLPQGVTVTQYQGEFPADSMVGVILIKKQKKVPETNDKGETVMRNRHVPVGVVVWPIPSVDTFLNDPKGRAFLTERFFATCADDVVRPLRDKDEAAINASIGEIPVSVADYVAETQRPGLITVYNDLFPALIKDLREEKLPKSIFIKKATAATFRECLQSKAAAQALAPKLEELGVFVWSLTMLRNAAIAANRPTAAFDDWLAHRDEATLDDEAADEFDFSDLTTAAAPAPATPTEQPTG